MIPRPSFSLSTKILLLAFLNVVLLGFVFLLFARIEFRFELSSFLFAPGRDRIVSASRLIALQLPTEPAEEWNNLLAQYSASYPAEFYLFSSAGDQLAGHSTQLPSELVDFIRHDPHAHRAFPPMEDHSPPLLLLATRVPHRFWAGVHIPIWRKPGREPISATLVWEIQNFLTNPFYFDYKPWLVIVLAVLAVSILCWLPFIRRLTSSIGQVTTATGEIAAGRFDVTLPSKRQDELGRLSESISQMARRLAEYVYGQKRFLGDIAHELCSPIARIQIALGILEQRAEHHEISYIEDVREEVEHMSGLVNELLSFSKAQITAETPLTPVNVFETVERVLQREASNQVQIKTDVNRNLEVMAQPEYLLRSLANVVRNAMRYAGQSGPVLISAVNGNGQVKITIADSGPGLPESELQQIFKPFYRPDQARQRDTGGAGLGLAIVKTCIEACGGTVLCRNRLPHGLEVEIRLRSASMLRDQAF